jgi:predicted amidohydrolase
VSDDPAAGAQPGGADVTARLIIAGGHVIDPASGVDAVRDVAIAGGRIEAVEADASRRGAGELIDASDRWVLPGLVDTHAHLCPPFGGSQGFRMLARAGVTTALDLAGDPRAIVAGMHEAGAGLTVGVLAPLIPGDTVSGASPSRAEIERVRDRALEEGALGVKVLGGHYPLTPEATAEVIRAAHRARAWCAVHAGTTATGSDIEGLEELLALADGLPVHVAHVNSYCRGQRADPLLEVRRALDALERAPRARSESYLALINGAHAGMEDGVPRSRVVATCLAMGGFPATARGMEDAIARGWAKIHGTRGGETVLLDPEDGLAEYRRTAGEVGVSFAVNPPASAIALALARGPGGFVVTAISTDGGAIPRNTTIAQGLALVRYGALSRSEFVVKACLNPARMMGLPAKGHLAPGADADVAIVEPHSARVEWVIAGGRVIVRQGGVVGRGGCVVTGERGRRTLADQGVPTTLAAPAWLEPAAASPRT